MILILVESPTKARTLSKFLGKGYTIEATMGHIRDLPKSKLGVDVDHDFLPSYIIPKEKKKRVAELKAIAEKSSEVILATDPDREGEAIAWHIAAILTDQDQRSKIKDQKKSLKKTADNEKLPCPSNPPIGGVGGKAEGYKRIVFHEITESAILDAVKHPQEVDMHLVDAQQARRVLDRLVGYTLSPLLWRKLSRRWLSAGRVQSVAVRLIVEREKEIRAFLKVGYFTIHGVFIPSGQKVESLSAALLKKDGVPYEKSTTITLFDGTYTSKTSRIQTEDQADVIISDIISPFTVSAVEKKEIRRIPPAPFTTSTLQQDSGRKFSFSAKKTMQIAQKLYEEGYITYHRTDSVNLSEKFLTEAREYIGKTHGEAYLPEKKRMFQTKSKVAQEAHEAIRPTTITLTGENFTVPSDMNHDHVRLYELIWKRAVGSQAKEAVFDSTSIEISSSNGYVFGTQGSVIQFDGFLKIIGREADETVLPSVTVGDEVALQSCAKESHESSPPPRYTEASLIKALEEKDIGRPSTYAPIISTVQERQYVVKQEKKLVPTDLGFLVTDFLVKYFSHIMDLPFTAKMEASLDEIANGSPWVPVIRAFYEPFMVDMKTAEDGAEKVKMAEEMLDETCPTCGGALVIRTGKFGKFIACSTFPACKYTRQLVETIDKKCPKCGADIVVKKTRTGKTFFGCGSYPTCTFAAWKKEDIK